MASVHDSSAHDSSGQFNADTFSATNASYSLEKTRTSSSGKFWLNGEVAGCQCPECGGPMSIRLWLLTADCALCGTSLELTEEQERELQDLIHGRVTPPPPPPPPPAPIKPVVPQQQQQTTRPAAKTAASTPPQPQPKKAPRPQEAKPKKAEVKKPEPKKPQPAAIKLPELKSDDLFASASSSPTTTLTDTLPQHEDDETLHLQWLPGLISTILHILLVMLLALMSTTFVPYKKPPILLTATWANEGKEGDKKQALVDDERTVKIEPGPEQAPVPKPQPKPEPPKPVEIKEKPPEPPKEVSTPEIVAKDFRPSDLADANLPSLAQVHQQLSSTNGSRMSQGRDPRLRSQMVEHEGGNDS
jgi:hypothetical protein